MSRAGPRAAQARARGRAPAPVLAPAMALALAVVLVPACHTVRAGAPAAVSLPAVSGELRIDFVDVGHGDAALVTSPLGKTVLIDGGLAQAGDTLAAYVHSRTLVPLDLVLLTHRHADHLGGLATVISRQGARLFLDAVLPHPSPAYDALIRLLDERHVPVREATRGRVIDLGGGAAMVLLTPPEPLITGSRSDVNANSVVARLVLGRVRILLMADAEAVTETWLLDAHTDLRADVLKVAHHGSRFSSTAAFLQAVAPRVAVVSGGPATAVGHLHADTLARLEVSGARLYRTDVDGTITVRTDGRDVSVETARTTGARRFEAVP